MRTIRLAIILLCGICLQMGASTIDSLRQVVPTLKGNERSKAYMKLSQLLSSEDDPQAALRQGAGVHQLRRPGVLSVHLRLSDTFLRMP